MIVFLVAFLGGCTPPKNQDTRPKNEIVFLKRVDAERSYCGKVGINVAEQDAHIKAFNKYALDSLQHIQDWKMIFIKVNDNTFKSGSVASTIGVTNLPCYNVELVAPIGLIRSEDEFGGKIDIMNRVDFIYTLLKEPHDVNLEKRIDLIRTLKEGDTVIVSGALTHADLDGKITFAPIFVDDDWNVDLLATKFEKAAHK